MNKGIFKIMFDTKINKNDIYDNVVLKCCRRKLNFKYTLIPICFILIFVGFNINKNINIEDDEIIINKVLSLETLVKDELHSESSKIELPDIDFYKSITIPFEYNVFKVNKVSNLVSQYTISYEKGSKRINIMFSLENDVYYQKNVNNVKSTIDGVTMELLNCGNKYMAIFENNDKYFNVETINISEEEFITLIKSIIN